MSNSFKVLFWIYKSRVNKKGESPLMLRVSYNNERKQLFTGFNLPVSKWDVAKSKMKGKDEIAEQINNYIRTSTARIHELFTEQIQKGDIYLNKLLDKFLGKDEQNYTLMQLIQYQMEQMQSKIGKDYSIATIKKYRVTVGKIEKFLAHQDKKDIRLKDLALKFIYDFDHFMKTGLGNDHNTTVKHCKNLKTFINVALVQDWIDRNPFIGFKNSYKLKEKVYLNQQELDIIQSKHLKMPRLALVRDLFIFQCYTGLAYIDMANLKGRDVTIGIDGMPWIIIYRQKSNIRCSIPLLPQALKVLEHYNPNYKDNLDNKLLPVYSNQKFNSYLIEIADLCGIDKVISSHAGRRTFSTTVALANGISIETIRAIIGHSQGSRITHQYAAVTDLKVSKEIKSLRAKMK